MYGNQNLTRILLCAISVGQIEVHLLIFYLVLPYSGHLQTCIVGNRFSYFHAFI